MHPNRFPSSNTQFALTTPIPPIHFLPACESNVYRLSMDVQLHAPISHLSLNWLNAGTACLLPIMSPIPQIFVHGAARARTNDNLPPYFVPFRTGRRPVLKVRLKCRECSKLLPDTCHSFCLKRCFRNSIEIVKLITLSCLPIYSVV